MISEMSVEERWLQRLKIGLMAATLLVLIYFIWTGGVPVRVSHPANPYVCPGRGELWECRDDGGGYMEVLKNVSGPTFNSTGTVGACRRVQCVCRWNCPWI